MSDFNELEKKSIDALVDSLKYVATTSGIVIAMYSQSAREYLKLSTIANDSAAQALVFAPLMCLFLAIAGTVAGIFPREYRAHSDSEKERTVLSIRRSKVRWARAVLTLFLSGFGIFMYIIAAQIWRLYPF